MILQHALKFAAAMVLASGVLAQAPPAKSCTEPSCPVAQRGSAIVTVADLMAKVKALPAKQQNALLNDSQQINKTIENLLILRQIANEVDPADVAADVLLQARLKIAYDEIIAVHRLDQIRKERVTADFEKLAYEHYLTNMAAMKTPKELTVRHLLVSSRKVGEDAAKAKVEELAKQLHSADQKQFTDLVIAASDDSSKTDNAGIIKLTEGTTDFDPDFVAGSFALTEVGQISPPVRSQFGYHLIQLIEVTPAKVIPFEQAKTGIIEKLRGDAHRRVVLEYRTDVSMSGELKVFPENLQGLINAEDAQ